MSKQLFILLILSLSSFNVMAAVDPQVAIDAARSDIRQVMAVLLAALLAIGISAALIFVAASTLRWLRRSA